MRDRRRPGSDRCGVTHQAPRLCGLSTIPLGACCYKTHVPGKHKRFCILLLFALLIFSIGTSCTSHMTRDDDSVEEIAQTADEGDEEEVVETDGSSSSTASEEERIEPTEDDRRFHVDRLSGDDDRNDRAADVDDVRSAA